MSVEQHYLDRVDPPFTFRAPSNEFQHCSDCGLCIMPDELIVNVADDEFMHFSCFDGRLEEARIDE